MMSLRERKKLWTRQAIVDAALELFLNRGYDETTVDAIAEAAGVSRSTFFRYFETKDAAFFANQEQRIEQFRQFLAKHSELPPLERVQLAFLDTAQVYTENRDLILAQVRVVRSSRNLIAYDQQLDQRWEGAIAEALAESATTPAERRKAALLAGAIIGIARTIFRAWIDSEGESPIFEDASAAREILEKITL